MSKKLCRLHDFKCFRQKHEVFAFKGFTIDFTSTGDCSIQYVFQLDGKTRYSPRHIFYGVYWSDTERIRRWAYHLGLVETISYWKAYCPQYLELPIGEMSEFETLWWQDLFYHGLGEFRYLNGLMDLGRDEFCPEFVFSRPYQCFKKLGDSLEPSLKESLVPLGGGKDSALALNLACENNYLVQPFAINPTPSVIALIQQITPKTVCSTVFRSIDPMLIEDNKNGALNGHTPFSAVVGFLSCAYSDLSGYREVLISNEDSANESTVHEEEVNHQYSKSWDFEKKLQIYLKSSVGTKVRYLSVLRPINELQVLKAVLKRESILAEFVSCNVLGRDGKWCGECPKCLCVALMIAGLSGIESVLKVFGENILIDKRNLPDLLSLLGFAENKPFECVSTVGECRAALARCLEFCSDDIVKLPHEFYSHIANARSVDDYLKDWNQVHACPKDWQRFLRAEYNLEGAVENA